MRQQFLQYFKPSIDASDVAAIVDSLNNGWLTTGPKVKQFEDEFARLCGVKHAIALNSCTAALHLGLIALGVGPGDEVVMPSFTFVAGAQCARHLGATPVFADIDESTLCIDVATIQRVVTSRTKVIIPMPYGGRPARIRSVVEFARSRNIAVLEDAAHAVGTLDNGNWAGVVSDGAAYSFYATKNITSAEGGMFVTNNDGLAEEVRILSLHGMDKDAWKRYTRGGSWRYDVVATGYKDNMPDVCAALGIAQLRRLAALQQRREEIAARYLEAVAKIPGLQAASPMLQPPDRHSWCIFAVLANQQEANISRDELIVELNRANIGTSVHFIPTHLFSAYDNVHHATLAATEEVARRILSLPLYPSMSDEDVEDVITALERIIDTSRGAEAVETTA